MPRLRRAEPSDDRPTHRPARRVGLAVIGVALVAATVGALAWPDDTGPDEGAFCERLGSVQHLDDRLATDPAGLAQDVAQLRRAADVAPDDVAAAVEVVLGLLERLEAAAAARPEDPQAGIDQALRNLRPEEVDATSSASQALGRYADDRCGIDLAGTREPDPVGSPEEPVATSGGAEPAPPG